MSYRGDFALGSTFDLKFSTRRFSTGAPYTLAGTPAVAAYPDNSTTEITAGITLTVDFDSRTGLNNVRVVATSGNGYAAGSNYDLVITAGTVDSISVVGEVIGSFSIEARSAMRPTTAGRTLDVTATGAAGIDWGNVENKTTANDLSGTDIQLCDTITTYTGNTVQTGDSFARLGAPAGASVSADIAAIEAQTDDIGAAGAGLTAIPWNAAWDAEVQSEVADALTAYGAATATDVTTAAANVSVDEIQATALADLFNTNSGTTYGAAVAGSPVKEIADNAGGAALTEAGIADAVWDEVLAGHLTAGTTGNALNAAGAAGDPWSTAIPGAYGAGTAGKILGDNINATISSRASQTSVDTIDNLVDDLESRLGTPSNLGSGATVAANLVDIESQTDDIGAAGAGLTAVPWNAAWDAEVQSEAADALTAYDPPTHTEMTTELATADDAVLAAIAALNDLSAAEVNAEMVDVMATDTYVESSAVVGSSATIAGMLTWLKTLARNKITQTTTTQTLRNNGDTADVAAAAVSDDGTTFTRGKWA